jgi:uncharacterized membrane protein YcaP (DUF421 family)
MTFRGHPRRNTLTVPATDIRDIKDADLRGLAIYLMLLTIIRLSGRRTLAQMTPFNLVIVLVISESSEQAMLGDDFSITNAIILILTQAGATLLNALILRHLPLRLTKSFLK